MKSIRSEVTHALALVTLTISSVSLTPWMSHGLPPVPVYRITNLGTLGGSYSLAQDINNLGQVVGYSLLTDNTTQRAFRTGPNAAISPASDDLGTLGGTHSTAVSINDLGQVVGDSYLADNSTPRAFRTSPNSPISLATDDLGGGGYSQAGGINNSGRVAGGQGNSNAILRAYRTAPDAPINLASDLLGNLGGVESVGYGINASGQVTGYSLTVGNDSSSARAIRVSANGTINASSNLGTLGGQLSIGLAINDAGQVVGESRIAGNGQTHAFRTAPNAPINPATDDLGLLPGGSDSRANDINNLGWVVGQADVGGGYRAFLHHGGTMLDLNHLLDGSGLGWTLLSANAINDRNQIVGLGSIGGQFRAFRLDPVPEPGLAALLTAFAGMVTAFSRTLSVRGTMCRR